MENKEEYSNIISKHRKTNNKEEETNAPVNNSKPESDIISTGRRTEQKMKLSNHTAVSCLTAKEERKDRLTSDKTIPHYDHSEIDDDRIDEESFAGEEEKCILGGSYKRQKSYVCSSSEYANNPGKLYKGNKPVVARPTKQILGIELLSDGDIALKEHYTECAESPEQTVDRMRSETPKSTFSNTPVDCRKLSHYQRQSINSPLPCSGQAVNPTIPKEDSTCEDSNIMTYDIKSTPTSNPNHLSHKANSKEPSVKSAKISYSYQTLPSVETSFPTFDHLHDNLSKPHKSMPSPYSVQDQGPTFPNNVPILHPQPSAAGLGGINTPPDAAEPGISQGDSTTVNKSLVQFKTPNFGGTTPRDSEEEDANDVDPHTVLESATKRKASDTNGDVTSENEGNDHLDGSRKKRCKATGSTRKAKSSKSDEKRATCENCYNGHLKCSGFFGPNLVCEHCYNKRKRCIERIKKRGNKDAKPKNVAVKQDEEEYASRETDDTKNDLPDGTANGRDDRGDDSDGER